MYLGALLLGVVSGLRVFTPPAALLLTRGGVRAIVAAVFALWEYFADLQPWIPARTTVPSFVARIISGALTAWFFTKMHGGSSALGAILGIIGAVAGTRGGYAMRTKAIERIGAIPAAILEDASAIAIAALVVLKIF
jgi:uncharacterized membrane protein